MRILGGGERARIAGNLAGVDRHDLFCARITCRTTVEGHHRILYIQTQRVIDASHAQSEILGVS